MKNQTYSRTSPKDGRRATLGANGKYSRKNNKGYIINQGIGNLLGTTGEVQLTNTNTGSTVDSNTGNGGFDTGGTNLKRGRSLNEMKTDMSGAAVVASFLLGYAMNKGSKLNIIY